MTNYNDGNWHGWNGGECPVHPETVVDEMGLKTGFRSGRRSGDIAWHMSEEQCCNPIIAFRVIKEHKEPRDFWIMPEEEGVKVFTCGVTASESASVFGFDVIHVREVIKDD